jgi:hypothetical protein
MLKIQRAVFTVILAVLLLPSIALKAQTDMDAIMMAKKNLCIGGSYGYNSWKDYWEGTLHRNNQNLGTVSTQIAMFMGTYGITRKLNAVVSVPYVWTHSTAGTLHGQHGIQDLSAWLKYQAIEQHFSQSVLSIFVLGGASLPLTNYIADYLPLSIGLQSKTLSARLIVDYQHGKFFATASGTYTWRSSISIDRNAYYTTSLHLTNEVDMPDVVAEGLRIGYRSPRWVIEALASNMNTPGGFDMRRNDMPFPSNRMNSTMAGAHVKYSVPAVRGLELNAEGDYTVAGRNVGQSTMFDFGVFYILDFSKKKPKTN